ncbi:adenosine receptor A2b isoform X2 [Patella vulgata]|uniref:adenosine receptor A2b isoform X2 n=1 Tax=Patella vulgata TaxID=6465 RepID=UPI0021805339|nr:adenosine receptor A2b isoform X2 [Patella vulgata]
MVVLAEYSDLIAVHKTIEKIAIIKGSVINDNINSVKNNDGELSLEQIVGIAITAVMVPFILLSNILVIVAVKRFKRLQIPTNYFLVSLSAADIFIALVIPFFMAVEVLQGDIRNVYICLSPNRVLVMACGVSILTLAIVAYDRYTALLQPLEYINIMTVRKIVSLVALSWAYSAAISWLPLFVDWHDGIDQYNVCSFKLLYSNAHILFLGVVFGPACVVIFFCYSRIYAVAKYHARAIAAVETSIRHNLELSYIMKDTKCAKTLGLVIGVFLCLWLPYLAFLVIDMWLEQPVNEWLRNYLALLAFLNSGLNPWVYAFKNNEFRAAFRRIIREHCLYRLCESSERRSSTGSDISIFQGPGHALSRTNSRMLAPDVFQTKTKMEDVLPASDITLYRHFLPMPKVNPHSLFPSLVKPPVSRILENTVIAHRPENWWKEHDQQHAGKTSKS